MRWSLHDAGDFKYRYEIESLLRICCSGLDAELSKSSLQLVDTSRALPELFERLSANGLCRPDNWRIVGRTDTTQATLQHRKTQSYSGVSEN